MNKKQYNNVIENTLKHEQTEDTLSTTRAIFDNMGVALPQGDMKTVYETIKTDNYMGWKSCTMKEAQEAANNGTAAIGISEDKIVVLSANDEEQPVAQTASVMSLDENTSAFAVDGLQYYSYSYGGTEQGGGSTVIPPTYLVDQLTGIQTFSYLRDGEKNLSKNFKVKEFRCKDGSDEILIDMALVVYLQAIRDWAGASITINSGYRTPNHNASIGGASNSQHIYGKAVDIVCSDKTPLQLAQRAETLGMKGIEWNADLGYTHIDTRTTKWYVKRQNSTYINVSSFYNY